MCAGVGQVQSRGARRLARQTAKKAVEGEIKGALPIGHRVALHVAEYTARFYARQAVKQFGIEVETLLAADPTKLVDLNERTFNVFYVPDAVGSPNIPAQAEFVIPNGIRSVLGFGGVLPSSDLFAIILFSKVPISSEVAEMFKPLALNVKVAVLPFDGETIFA